MATRKPACTFFDVIVSTTLHWFEGTNIARNHRIRIMCACRVADTATQEEEDGDDGSVGHDAKVEMNEATTAADKHQKWLHDFRSWTETWNTHRSTGAWFVHNGVLWSFFSQGQEGTSAAAPAVAGTYEVVDLGELCHHFPAVLQALVLGYFPSFNVQERMVRFANGFDVYGSFYSYHSRCALVGCLTTNIEVAVASPRGSLSLSATCGRCRVPRYCSKRCQVLHWRTGHKRACTTTTKPLSQKAKGTSAAAAQRLLLHMLDLIKKHRVWRRQDADGNSNVCLPLVIDGVERWFKKTTTMEEWIYLSASSSGNNDAVTVNPNVDLEVFPLS